MRKTEVKNSVHFPEVTQEDAEPGLHVFLPTPHLGASSSSRLHAGGSQGRRRGGGGVVGGGAESRPFTLPAQQQKI